jgi:hypothetical protein
MADMSIYNYVPHHRTAERLEGRAPGPVKAKDQMPHDTAVQRFNARLAVKVTDGVGTMWCAYAFAALALVSLPEAISSHSRNASVVDLSDVPPASSVVGDHRRPERARGGR